MLNFEKFWNSINFIFLSLCLTQFHSFHSQPKNFYKFYFFLITFLAFALILFLIYDGSLYVYHLNKNNPNMSYIINVVLFLKYVTMIIMATETWLNRQSEQKLFNQFTVTEKLFFDKFNVQMDYSGIFRKLKIFLIALCIYSIVYSAARIYYVIPGSLITNSKQYNIMFCISTFFIRIRCIQIILLGKLLTNNLSLLNGIIEKYKYYQNRRKHDEFIRNLNDLRIIYLKCWRITRYIDQCYGWSLVAFVLQCIVDHTTGCYRIYDIWGHANALLVIVGKLERIPYAISEISMNFLFFLDFLVYTVVNLILLFLLCKMAENLQKKVKCFYLFYLY